MITFSTTDPDRGPIEHTISGERRAGVIDALGHLVPLEISRMSGDGWTPDVRIAAARRAWAAFQAAPGAGGSQGGAGMMFGGQTAGRELASLATALAALAYQPGGVSVFGRHWCVDHAECVKARRSAGLPPPAVTP